MNDAGDSIRGCWTRPPELPSLGGDNVHVWRASLNAAPNVVRNLRTLLSDDELMRASRFHYDLDRDHFIVARGLLRRLLAAYVRVTPAEQLSFRYTEHGKPVLTRVQNQHDLDFNVSHCAGLVVYAVARGRRIGVDIERMRSDLSSDQIASRFFSRTECARIRALPGHLRTEAFFNCWTRKEAYVKAIGKGLSQPLGQFDVSVAPGEPAALLKVEGVPTGPSRWHIEEIRPDPRFKGALVVEGGGWELKCLEGSIFL